VCPAEIFQGRLEEFQRDKHPVTILLAPGHKGQAATGDNMGHLRTENRSESPSGDLQARLGSWKEIAAFFDKDVRTVRRWEAERSLPVHRIPGGRRGGVYAYVSELQAWLANEEEAAPEPELPAPIEVAPAVEADVSTVTAAGTVAQARRFGLGTWAAAALVLLAVGIFAGLKLEERHRARVETATGAAIEPAGRPSANAEAQELYLRGLYLWNQRTEASLTESARLFREAIARDPKFAAAYAGLADSYILLRQYGHMADGEAFPLALAANQQALALDDSSPEAHRTNAFLLNYWIWNFPAAEREFQRTLALRPGDAQAHHWYATSLFSVGRYQDALREIDIARRLQPDSISILANRGLLLTPIDQDGAFAYLKEVERVNPGFASVHTYLANIEEVRRDFSGFLDELRMARALRQDENGAKVIDAAAKELKAHGETAMYRVLADGAARAADAGHGEALLAASFYARIEDEERTLHYMTLSCDRREASFIEVTHDPWFGRLSGNAEYEALMVRRATPLPLAVALRAQTPVAAVK
jgi:tetratricopeptide (TPR) repeat protein